MDILGAIGLAIGFLAYRVVAITWTLFRWALTFAVLYGAIHVVKDTELPIAGEVLEALKAISFESYSWWAHFEWLASNWSVIAVLLVFLESRAQRTWRVQNEDVVSYAKLFMATMLTYFQIEPQVKGQSVKEPKSVFETLEAGLRRRITVFLIGKPFDQVADDTLWALSARGGERATFEQDARRLRPEK